MYDLVVYSRIDMSAQPSSRNMNVDHTHLNKRQCVKQNSFSSPNDQ